MEEKINEIGLEDKGYGKDNLRLFKALGFVTSSRYLICRKGANSMIMP